MKKYIYALLVITIQFWPADAQNLIGYTPEQITKQFPNKEVQITPLKNGEVMLSVNPKDDDHTTFYYIDGKTNLCYFYSIAAPAREYEFAKDHFNSEPKQFYYAGKTADDWPYWIEIVKTDIYYWTLMLQNVSGRYYTIVFCGLNHP